MGKNGAGKTSLFRILIGKLGLCKGEAFIAGCSLTTDKNNAEKNLGFCPQFDALDEGLTVVENLHIFASIRGISGSQKPTIIDSLISALSLEGQASKLTKNLSGGNKRKTSLAMALMGLPPVLLLDEPTAGIDPTGRHQISRLLTKLRIHNGITVLIASHSLDVIQSTCTEIAVMEYGNLKFRGSLQEFAKNSCSFELRIKANDQQSAQNVDSMVTTAFPDCQQNACASLNELSYTIHKRNIRGSGHDCNDASWSGILTLMDKIHTNEKLTDFEASETFLGDLVSRM